MCSSAPLEAGALKHSRIFALGLLAWCLGYCVTARAQAAPAGPEPAYRAALVTYGPGPIYWQRFGHNAIWLQEPARGLDHTFNFGYFDFEQESFLLRFVQGRMLYFSLAQPAEREFAQYRAEGRSIRVQVLDLDRTEYARLRDHLLWQVRPENRDYLYDYYLDNCSTRIRDALDVALDGDLRGQFVPQTAEQTFRDHTRRSIVDDYWYYLGLELALGMPIDRAINRWEEMFLPAVLADGVLEVNRLRPFGPAPLVSSDGLLFDPASQLPPAQPPELWPRYLVLALALAFAFCLIARLAPAPVSAGLAQGWVAIAGALGWLMVAVWLWTDHDAAHPNVNLLLLNPLMMLALVLRLRPMGAALLAAGVVAAVPFWWLTGIQYARDVIALLAPVNLAVAAYLWRRYSAPA